MRLDIDGAAQCGMAQACQDIMQNALAAPSRAFWAAQVVEHVLVIGPASSFCSLSYNTN